MDGYWGYCSPSCSGELPSPTSKYSLTTQPNLWNLALFDLSTWGSGICYTYDPPSEVGFGNSKKVDFCQVEPGVFGQMYALLGHQ